ncbi:hypothetical protein OSG_eHP36_00135 [environmental Halophage eHP-36]|jgi:hypothetical protein|nr:hypothetical protein OSG_eHP36_00135 [environmental Halophage eHP-36]
MSSGIPTGDRVQQLREHIENGNHPDSFVPESEPETEHGKITVAECLRMREWYDDPDTSLSDIADVVGVNSDVTVWNHVNGECKHGNITKRQCNAIRCAAQDGKYATEMVELFTFFNTQRTAYDHATGTGTCSHTGGVEPVTTTEEITATDCRRMRSWYETSDKSQHDIADAVGHPRTTIQKHLDGRCSHNNE